MNSFYCAGGAGGYCTRGEGGLTGGCCGAGGPLSAIAAF